jgi:phosphate transport system substrate-binding protein
MGSSSSNRARPTFVLVVAGCVCLLLGRVGAQTLRINGAGATLPLPLYSKWFAEYNRIRSDVQINYQAIGSGGGIRQLQAQTVFFGATDGPMTARQLTEAPGRILHLPASLGAVVVIYNIPTVRAELKFSGQVLADIFLGKITKWNDAALLTLNPAVPLPDTDITVAHRADGSGTTYIWADYLSKVSAEWKGKVGVSTSVNWPTGIGGRGTDGVAGLVSQVPGTIGYVELIYALQTGMPFGSVRNMAGEFVKASVESVGAAAASTASQMPADFRVSIANAPGKGAYPIASFSWFLLYEDPRNKEQSRAMVDFVRWALTDGQRYCAALGYAPLPEPLVRLEMAALARIRTS